MDVFESNYLNLADGSCLRNAYGVLNITLRRFATYLEKYLLTS